MTHLIDKERLARTFITLCEISTPSRAEKPVADYLIPCFRDLGADFIHEDDSAAATGSNSGNLIIRFNGATDRPPLFFSCHMDTVSPGEGVRVQRHGDRFTSAGDTVLGGDDKSGIAPLIELVTLLKEHKKAHRTVEFVFTTCEEIGLLGAKNLDHSHLQSRFGYALDTTGVDRVIIGAPAANKVRIDIQGRAAHAGINPEAGISAIVLAAQAVTRLNLGRIDEESTANIGLIKGGTAVNIIPEHIRLHGEVRSHSTAKLDAYTADMKEAVRRTIDAWPSSEFDDGSRPSVTFKIEADYPVMRLKKDDLVIETVRRAEKQLKRKLSYIIAGGGSDANILNGYGLQTAILATGMNGVHTTDEWLELGDMVKLTELLYAIVTE